MVRWSLALAASLGVLAIAIGVVLWIASANATATESVRESRVVHQQLKQQFTVLQSSAHEPLMSRLNQSLDALKISLVEIVAQTPLPDGVTEIGFEQQLLPPMLDAGEPYPVTALRLSLTMSVEHSVGLLNMLERVTQGMSVWPFEVRGCDLHRLLEREIKAHCVLDFYHWVDESIIVEQP